MTIIQKDFPNGVIVYWVPFNKTKHISQIFPDAGYLGTATVIDGRSKGIGFHAWEQSDSEFIYYKIA